MRHVLFQFTKYINVNRRQFFKRNFAYNIEICTVFMYVFNLYTRGLIPDSHNRVYTIT